MIGTLQKHSLDSICLLSVERHGVITMFDASPLYWPSSGFQPLLHFLETVKLDREVVLPSLRSVLLEFRPWLQKGLTGFRPPSDRSRKALTQEDHLQIGERRLPVEKSMVNSALVVSLALVGDEKGEGR